MLERSFAHAYETGGMRRTHLRGHRNILKRLLIHLGAFNLSLMMRQRTGKGTPRGWQGYSAETFLALCRLGMAILAMVERLHAPHSAPNRSTRASPPPSSLRKEI